MQTVQHNNSMYKVIARLPHALQFGDEVFEAWDVPSGAEMAIELRYEAPDRVVDEVKKILPEMHSQYVDGNPCDPGSAVNSSAQFGEVSIVIGMPGIAGVRWLIW